MGKIIGTNFEDRTTEHTKDDFSKQSEINYWENWHINSDNTNSLNETLKEIFSYKEKLNDVLNKWDNLEDLSEEEIKKYIQTFMMYKLVKEYHEISSEIFLSTEYIWSLILNFLLGKESLDWEEGAYKYAIDYLEENEEGKINYKKAGDLNTLKYIYWFDKYRHNFVPANEMLKFAMIMYQAAYNTQDFKIWKNLSENLSTIDKKLNLQNIVYEMFPQKSLTLL